MPINNGKNHDKAFNTNFYRDVHEKNSEKKWCDILFGLTCIGFADTVPDIIVLRNIPDAL